MTAVYIAVAVVLGVVILLVSFLLNARKDIRKHIEQNVEQSRRHMELSQKFNRQLEVRHDAIKRLLHEKYEPETLAFFIHLTDPSSHIPDNIFEKVDSYQEHIAKKNKDMGYGNA